MAKKLKRKIGSRNKSFIEETPVLLGASLIGVSASGKAWSFLVGMDQIWLPRSAVEFRKTGNGDRVPFVNPSMLRIKGIVSGHFSNNYDPDDQDDHFDLDDFDEGTNY